MFSIEMSIIILEVMGIFTIKKRRCILIAMFILVLDF